MPAKETDVYIGIPDLVAAGLLSVGQTLYAHRAAYEGGTCVVTEDGWLKVGDATTWSPSGAGRLLTGHGTRGWYFWQTEKRGGDRLKDLRNQYADERGVTAMDEDDSDES